jgi:hypothetical protein
MADTKQILFGGVGALPPKAAEFKKPKPGERPSWFEKLEESFVKLTSTDEGKRLYGDPDKGATLEQVWRTSTLFTGKSPVCLVSTDQPPVESDAIERVIKMSSKDLVASLIGIFEMGEPTAVQLLYHDGHMGHSITLLEWHGNTQRFTYHDPWPGDSLLSKDFNAAGVDAQRTNGSWSITAAELEKVVFAALMRRPLWSEYMGEKYYLTFDEFITSDFWKFFHISEVERLNPDAQNNTLVKLKPGGFQSEIDLNVTVNPKDRLVEGVLSVARRFVVGPPAGLNPLALDLVRSFIAALIPPPDQDAVSELIKILKRIADPAQAEQLINEGPKKSNFHLALFTYLGPSPAFEQPLEYSNLAISNLARDGADWLQILITADAL